MIINPSIVSLQYQNVAEPKDAALVNLEERVSHSRKRVCFFLEVTAREHLHFNNYSADEVAMVWYTRDDFALMKQDRRDTLALIDAGEYPGDDAHRCARGLEIGSRSGALDRLRNKSAGWLAVFKEQSIQKRLAVHAPQTIAVAYIAATRRCVEAAYEVAVADALEASRFARHTTSRKVEGDRIVQYKGMRAILRVFRTRNLL